MTGPDTSHTAPWLADFYRDLHRHPELSFAETRTADRIATKLGELGIDTTTGVGGTGVVGMIRNGDGPTALLRADMDALPVEEKTGLPYASTVRATDPDGREVPVAHACGHDMHVTCLLGALEVLVNEQDSWSGTVMAVFQPAEELGSGSQAMVDDSLFERFGTPDVVLGQHIAPLPAGMLAAHPGPAFAGADSLRVLLHGTGSHGSMPQESVDPVVMAAATVLRLQTVVSRTVAPTDTVVVTVGSLQAGTKANVIPDDAELKLNIRTYDPDVRTRVLDSITRIVEAEAAASNAPKKPEISPIDSFPVLVNDGDAVARTTAAFRRRFGDDKVTDPGAGAASEDVGVFATASGAPICYWILGGADPAIFAKAAAAGTTPVLPPNHSPYYAPVIEPTITMGVSALVTAARDWLD
ncbi:amidohydrolase [Rhodococcus sp. TAF43]|uniref:amidohydrolase n=1 Tax=unclassified Rhodococcus (in: high G+C Gram-positive bacteria) TaxID=192944 RepID=UPI00158226A1|nr:amidohydrolase [Rhodococcus sp. W8901]QKT12515.1 amidohydrolase [Rhodococcus sp. W8901]